MQVHMTGETTTRLFLDQLVSSWAIDGSAVIGWFFILGLLYSVQDYETMITMPAGQPVTQVILDTVGNKRDCLVSDVS
jgi:hypothetical protein